MTSEERAIARLARDICWAGFIMPRPKGETAASYWKTLSESSRQSYLAEANRMAFLLAKLPFDTVVDAMIAARSKSTRC